tara:strand:- start:846 stop:2537 length:1692 start_codon:yes stop_codon:yes gene_type:complete
LAEAYAIETHANITAAVLETYQQKYGTETFARSDVLQIIDGSIREDDSIRYLNHFYDPINERGLRGRFSDFAPLNGLKLTTWATDILKQGNYGFSSIRSNEPLFSSETDLTWQRAVYEYVHGDRNYALKALGHQLHLVQDAAVPAHTRNDAHPPWDLGGDMYENYTKDKKPDTLDDSQNIPRITDIEDAINSVALFSNTNFLSRDSGFNEYARPAQSELRFEADFGVHKEKGHKVTRASKTFNRKAKRETIEYFFDDKDGEISKDYWRLLSREAVRYGVAVVDLFLKEVEKERATGALLAMNKSYNETESVMKKLATTRDSKLQLTSLAAADVYELNKDELDGYFAAAEIYGIHVPSTARRSPLKDDQPATALLGFENLKKAVIGEAIPAGMPPQRNNGERRQGNDFSELLKKLNQAAALLALLQEKIDRRERECIANSVRGPWDNFWWNGDKPGCDDPTPKMQKMFWAPIQGIGGAGDVLSSGPASGSISADPESGFFGWTDISWTSSGTDSCTVTGTNGSLWSGTSGTESVLLSFDTTFTLRCDGSDLSSVFADVDIPVAS